MAEVKRLNYFTSQFLVEKDFKDEQAYHVGMRRQLNQALHTWGVADGGLQVTKTGDKVVSVGAGLAMDKVGQEIVFLDSRSVDLSAFAPNADVYLTAAYQEVQDPADHYTSGGVDNYVRTTERPNLQASTTVPAGDGSAVALAKVHLDANGNVAGIDSSVRKFASSVIDPKSALQVSGLTVNGSLSVTGDTSLAGNIGIKGAVGIGATPPNQSLTIANTTGANYMNVKDGTREILMGVDVTGGILSVMSNHDLVFRAGANNEMMRITGGGNVGIGAPIPENADGWDKVLDILGTTNTKLSVRTSNIDARVMAHNSGWWGAPAGMILGTKTAHPLSLGTNAATRMTIDGAGNVGIGTTAPSAKLNVDPQGAGGIIIGNPNTSAGGFTSLSLSISAASGGNTIIQSIKSSGTAWGDIALNPQGGNVGVGTTTAENSEGWDKVLDIASGNTTKLSVRTDNVDARVQAHKWGWWGAPAGMVIGTKTAHPVSFGTSAATRMTIGSTGNVGIGMMPTSSKFTVAGSIAGGETTTGWVLGAGAWGPDNWLRLTTTQSGSVYHDLAVNSFFAAGAKRFDLAEVTAARADDNLEQGDVVVIDHECGSHVTRSTRPGDTSVYGVVSSYDQAAMVIGGYGGPEALKGQTDKVPIALIGRVKVKVSAENGAIHVGDLLTTSATPGHLMRCDDRLRYAGSIAGKALEPLTSGKGTITALVTLQ